MSSTIPAGRPAVRFIDTHNHILPGIDDGSPDIATSLAMAAIAAADGIEAVIATPHVTEGLYEGHDLDKRVALLQGKFDEMRIGIELVRGAEVPMSICMPGDAELLGRLAIGGRYILMESAETNFEQVRRAVYQVRLGGFVPVLAHPERTSFAHENLDRLLQLADREEVYYQVTVPSLEGLFGPAVIRTCAWMAKYGLVHLLATDAHSIANRAPRLSSSYKKLARLAGEEAAALAVYHNPSLMIEGSRMKSCAPGSSSARQRLLDRILRRA